MDRSEMKKEAHMLYIFSFINSAGRRLARGVDVNSTMMHGLFISSSCFLSIYF